MEHHLVEATSTRCRSLPATVPAPEVLVKTQDHLRSITVRILQNFLRCWDVFPRVGCGATSKLRNAATA